MTAQTQKVDVLAVMDKVQERLYGVASTMTNKAAGEHYDQLANELYAARTIVAELIEAALDVERRAGPDREPRLRAALTGGAA